jgi:hypothetical protein
MIKFGFKRKLRGLGPDQATLVAFHPVPYWHGSWAQDG